MTSFTIAPRAIPRGGDDSPAPSLARYVWRMSGKHQWGICLLALAVAGLSMAPLELQRRIVDGAVSGGELELLLLLGAAYLAMLLLQAGLKYLLNLYKGWLSESAIRYCRLHLARVHECRPETKESTAGGQAVSVIGQEIDKLGGFVGEALAQPCVNLGMLLVIMGYMLAVEPLVALFSLPFLLPQLVAVPWMQKALNRLVEQRVDMMRGLSDTITGLPKDGNDMDDSVLPEQLDGVFANRMRFFLLKFAMKGLINLLNGLAPLSALVFGGFLVLQGETTIGVVVAFTSGFERLSAPLRELIAYYRVAAQANVQHCMIGKWI